MLRGEGGEGVGELFQGWDWGKGQIPVYNENSVGYDSWEKVYQIPTGWEFDMLF